MSTGEGVDAGEGAGVGERAVKGWAAGGAGGVWLRPAQAEAIVLELEKTPSTVPVADLEVAETELVRLARHLPPADLRKAAIQARNILDTDGPEPEEQRAAARETLTLTNADHGVKFRGYLANDNAELIRAIITTGARPHKTLDGAPDPRSRDKRQADALSAALTLAATALDTGMPSPTIPRPGTSTTATPATDPSGTASTGTSSGPGPDTSSGLGPDASADSGSAGSSRSGSDSSADTSADSASGSGSGGRAGVSPRGDAGGGADGSAGVGGGGRAGGRGEGLRGDVVPGFGAKANITVTIDLEDLKAATATAIGQTVYTNGLSAATIRRMACDAKVIPIVLGSKSEPLDVGRCERLVTKAMRRALNTRDKGCVVCGAPPIMCDAHHLISWIDGGVTAVSNLVLLCRRHHTDLHNGHWHITITDDVVHVTRPTWADSPPLPSPRRPGPSRRDPLQPGPRPGTTPPPGRSEPPDRSAVGQSPTAGGGLDDPAQRRTAAGRSPAAPPTDPEDADALRAATYLAIWGEPLPADHQHEPPSGHPKLTPIDPWGDETADPAPAPAPAPVAPDRSR